jgi:drug/metabolite transporter (DMT)-like permease
MLSDAKVLPNDGKGGKESKEKEQAAATETAFWFGLLLLISVTMTVGNKYVMKHFHYPNLCTLLQNGTCVIVLTIGKISKMADIKEFSMDQFVTFSVCAICLTGQIVSMLYALPLVAIATTVVFRTIVLVTVAFLDWMFFGYKFKTTTLVSLVVATIGMVIYAVNDINYNFEGYMWLLVNSSVTCMLTFWNRFYITRYKKEGIQTPTGISLVQQIETIPIILALMGINHEFKAAPLLLQQSVPTLLVFALTCLGGLLIAVAYANVYSLASATSVMLATTIYKAVSIVIGSFLFHTILSTTQIVGLVICITGGFSYSLAGSLDLAGMMAGVCGGHSERMDKLEARLAKLEDAQWSPTRDRTQRPTLGSKIQN